MTSHTQLEDEELLDHVGQGTVQDRVTTIEEVLDRGLLEVED